MSKADTFCDLRATEESYVGRRTWLALALAQGADSDGHLRPMRQAHKYSLIGGFWA
jgi:hypothetical protein